MARTGVEKTQNSSHNFPTSCEKTSRGAPTPLETGFFTSSESVTLDSYNPQALDLEGFSMRKRPKVQVSMRLKPNDRAMLEILAKNAEMTISQYLRHLIDSEIAENFDVIKEQLANPKSQAL